MCRRDRLLAQFGSKLSRERIVSERAGMKGLSYAKLLFVITVMMVLVVSLTYGADPTSTGRQTAIATFAGGCFWCMEPPYDEIDGVLSTISGYTGGTKKNPTYEQVTTGTTGHAEAVQIAYDPSKVSYEKLLEVFWRNIDPLTPNAQFCDHGSQYRSAIFYHDETQKRMAEASKAGLVESGRFNKPIVTEIVPASTFWPAEDYHQHYYVKSPVRYKFYRYNCG